MDAERPAMAGEKVFVIVVREALVGRDLADTIAETHPRARMVLADTLAAALVAVQPLEAVDLAFIAAEPAVFEASALAEALAARGAEVVLMGVTNPQGVRWRILAFPFSTADVRRFIPAI